MPQASGSKRARIVGTSQSRPMPLMMAPESEMVNQHESDGGAIKGKGKQVEVQHAPSFDSGRADTTTTRELSVENFPIPEVDGHDGLTDFEDEDEEQLVDLALKHPARFAETMATERATWNGTGGIDVSRPMVLRLGPGASSSVTPVPTTPTPMPSPRTRLAEPRLRQSTASPGTSGSATPVPPTPMPSPQTRLAEPRLRQSTASPGTSGSATPVPITPTPMPSPRTHLAELSVETPSPTEAPTRCATPESPVVTRSDTDLVFVNDSTRLLLKYQHPIIRTIVQKAIENLRATLVFQDAFPDGSVAFAFSKDALSAAAVSHKLGGGIVQRRLEVDDEYAAKLVSLPRARISLIRAEVKERCYAIVLGGFFSMASAHDIAQVVEKQLSAYTYTFPCVLRTNGMVRRSQPYRNDRIIAVVRDVYFTGGGTSFGAQFEHLFPTYQGADGKVNREVPISMVALVATALYATLYEWRTGAHLPAEFSQNAYMDVYQGHVNTLKHILENREGAFHTMMSDIYTRASWPIGNFGVAPSFAIADINLDELEE
ncbi:hypothetical protein EDB85DRAFT_2293098 [Lactarius pseudohatsudake]|nr:hypothetical protein EDB85DRAFT_2293098 [Lactarius pseudohatsudake]